MKNIMKKIGLIALFAMDIACLLIPWWYMTGFFTIIIIGMGIVTDHIVRTVVIATMYVVSVIFMEKKPKVFFVTGLLSLTMYLAVIFHEWGFKMSRMPGPYVAVILVIANIVAFVLIYASELKKNSDENITVKKIASIVGAVVMAAVIAVVVTTVQKAVEDSKKSVSVSSSDNTTVQSGTRPHNQEIETTEPEEEKEPGWVITYKELIKDNTFEELIDIPFSYSMVAFDKGGVVKGFFLYDIDKDEIPELMVQKIMDEYTGTMVYKYNTETSIVEVNGIYLENVAGELLYSGYSEDYEKEGGSGLLMYNHYPALGYRKDNGHIVKFYWNAGSMSAGIGIAEYDDNNNLVSSYEESYFTGEMYDVDNRLEKDGDEEAYKKIMEMYIPFMFVDITQENIDKYIVENYKETGMYSYSLEDCDRAYGFE